MSPHSLLRRVLAFLCIMRIACASADQLDSSIEVQLQFLGQEELGLCIQEELAKRNWYFVLASVAVGQLASSSEIPSITWGREW